MADFVNTTTLDVVLSVSDASAPWTVLTRAEATAALAIPQQYRKWTGTAVAEMTAPEKAVVDYAALKSAELAQTWKYRVKTGNTTRTATTALADDPDLSATAAANAVYIVRGRIFFETTAAGDFKFTLAGPASPVNVRIHRAAIAAGATAYSSIGVSTAFGTSVSVAGTGTSGGFVIIDGIFETGSTGGTVSFQWAQNTSDPGNTVVTKGSYIEFARIG